MNIAHATNKLGVVKANILHHLQRNGRSKVLDMEMVMSRGSLRAAVSSLVGQGYVTRVKDLAFDGIAITNAGRAAIGVEVPDTPSGRPPRICNASMTAPLQYEAHTTMGRVGLARIGAAGRVERGVAA